MTPWPGDCVVHDCHHEAVHVWRSALFAGIDWPTCDDHTTQVAQLLGIANPAKESR